MKKLKNEQQLYNQALKVGEVYAKKRAVAKFDASDSKSSKTELIYRLLVHDKLLQPLEKSQENEANMKHKLALWMKKQLPADHPLLQD